MYFIHLVSINYTDRATKTIMKQCVAHVKLGYGQLGLLLAYGQHRPSNAISRNELWSKIFRHTESLNLGTFFI